MSSKATSEMLEGASASATENTAEDKARASKVTPAFKRGAASEKKAAAKNKDTVCVALNRPYGIEFAMPDGRSVVLAGNGQPLVGKEKGVLPIGAYGLTTVAKEDWDYILKRYGTAKVFVNGLCFAARKRGDTIEEADQRGDLRNGLEPTDTSTTATRESSAE